MIKFGENYIYIDTPAFQQVYLSEKDAAHDCALLLLGRAPKHDLTCVLLVEPEWKEQHTFAIADQVSILDIKMIQKMVPQSDFYLSLREARKKLYISECKALFERANEKRFYSHSGWRYKAKMFLLSERIDRLRRKHFGRIARQIRFDVSIAELMQ